MGEKLRVLFIFAAQILKALHSTTSMCADQNRCLFNIEHPVRQCLTFEAPAEPLEFRDTRQCRVSAVHRVFPRFLSMPRQFVRRGGQNRSQKQRRCTPETTNMENERSSCPTYPTI